MPIVLTAQQVRERRDLGLVRGSLLEVHVQVVQEPEARGEGQEAQEDSAHEMSKFDMKEGGWEENMARRTRENSDR